MSSEANGTHKNFIIKENKMESEKLIKDITSIKQSQPLGLGKGFLLE